MNGVELNPATLVEVMRRLIKNGVPPTAIANTFELDAEVVANLTMTMRRERYGTAELSEAMSHLTWEAIEELYKIIRQGAPEAKYKAVMAVVGKALSTSVRQTPEEVATGRTELLRAMAEVRIMEMEGEEIGETSAFAAVDVPVDD